LFLGFRFIQNLILPMILIFNKIMFLLFSSDKGLPEVKTGPGIFSKSHSGPDHPDSEFLRDPRLSK
jgi:hypothetical protein